ncbi:hypothetical protein ONE63_011210 [Megalurothrips usitatus]|uniref:Uncharacterized protein n=1 Tax=Megalurothrips usitatus TaxID=439358 RepID=A0AAV7X364_9NEOP|nr:hypothetical protein ONE63_011210 [Megalurothrips usitatus]
MLCRKKDVLVEVEGSPLKLVWSGNVTSRHHPFPSNDIGFPCVRHIFFQWVATVPDASVHSFKLKEEERGRSSEFFHLEALVLLAHQVISNQSDAQLPWQK